MFPLSINYICLIIVNSCNFTKWTSEINLIYSGQQLFSFTLYLTILWTLVIRYLIKFCEHAFYTHSSNLRKYGRKFLKFWLRLSPFLHKLHRKKFCSRTHNVIILKITKKTLKEKKIKMILPGLGTLGVTPGVTAGVTAGDATLTPSLRLTFDLWSIS
jgi:hypothetical protein